MAKENYYENSRFKINDNLENFSFRNSIDLIGSTKSKEFLEKYIKAPDEFNKDYQKNMHFLWKNLIIDSILTLKINDRREILNRYAKSKNISCVSQLEKISKLSSFGIENLDRYFEDFIGFESLLYGAESKYRDHVDHVMKVWLIGLHILNTSMKYIQLSNGVTYIDVNFSFNIDVNHIIDLLKSKQNPIFIVKSEVIAIWTLIALCHDLGYPLEKATKINNKLKNIIEYFGTSKIDEFKYDFSIMNSFLVDKFLNITSSKFIFNQPLFNDNSTNFIENTKNDNIVSDYEMFEKQNFAVTSIQSKYKDKLSKSLEEYKHGILSSFLIFKSLTYFLETDYSYKESLSIEDTRQFYLRREILRAISGHTCPKLYHLDINNLSFLLILCDELQEWGRPKFDDMKYQSSLDEKVASIYIDEMIFNFSGNDTIRIRVEYDDPNFKDHEKDINKKIYGKFKFFHYLLRSAKDDVKRNFLYRWKFVYNLGDDHEKRVFRFRIKKSLDIFDIIKTEKYRIKKNDLQTDIKSIDIYS